MQDFREIIGRIGEEVGVSPWVEITQERIDLFAKATDDFQWIHVDPQRARASPYGTTIAHGYLTLSLLPMMTERTFSFESRRMGINYGSNKVRFTGPVPANSRIRARYRLNACDPIDDGGVQIVMAVAIEREGADKPVMVAEIVSRAYY